jgi:hypothetical protein
MRIEIYKKNRCGIGWTMCQEVYSMKELEKYIEANAKSDEVWELRWEIIKWD